MFLFILLLALSRVDAKDGARICCPTGECWTASPPFDHLPEPTGCISTLGVTFELFTRSNQNSPQTVTRTTIPSAFQGSRITVFIIHGWNNDRTTTWLHTMKNALLAKGDYNVIITGWGPGAGIVSYFPSAANTRVVGHEAAMVANNLVSNGGAAWTRVWCVGHSLGAHTCGHMGKATSGKMVRVTGLDPAGPGFKNEDNSISIQAGLNNGDGTFVDIVHTDSYIDGTVRYGTHTALGHIDFYPNAGGNQPGCSTERRPKKLRPDQAPPLPKGDLGCSHGLARDYFITSISSNCFRALSSCSSISNIPGSCSSCGSGCPYMGYETPSSARGRYYLTTTSSAPYCP